MWSDDYEEEICSGWVYAGSKERALGTVAPRRADEVDRTRDMQAFFEHFQPYPFYWWVHPCSKAESSSGTEPC
jgi:hypothetical protein